MAIIAAGEPEIGAPALNNSQGHCQYITGHSGLLETGNQHPGCSKWVSGPWAVAVFLPCSWYSHTTLSTGK